MTADLESARYVSFVSHRKNGTPVATPVWIVPFEGGWAFTTDTNSHKMNRIRNNPRVTITACNMKGAVVEGATVHPGSAVALSGADTQKVVVLVKRKYRIGWAMLGMMSLAKKITGKGSTATAEAAIKVTLD